ncbi:helix-turn-helix domain-containing protein [Desulfotignum balticum]|uniref:helix-turn-helix domain-containing protein n=1 Tax=Desulfotignum balticum TaxID=115781 RepID=UPI000410D7CF|nr:helix-turn-helix domain-containing protein [Desulfotignum balticum]
MGLVDSYRFVPCERFKKSREYEILPDGYFDLAFLLSDSTCRIFLAGPYTQKTNVPLGHFELIIVHFKVGRMPNFTNISPCELVNTMIELPHIYDLDSDTIGDWLLRRNTTDLRKSLLGKILGNVNVSRILSDKTYENAIALIDARDGQIQVGELARILNVSNRTLERKFRHILGIPPKKFAKLVRFQRVLEKLRYSSASGNLIDIAYEFGYADHAHFIRDFKSMSGILPSSFCD